MAKRSVLGGFITQGASGIEYEEGGTAKRVRNSAFERTRVSRSQGFRTASKKGNNEMPRASVINKNNASFLVNKRSFFKKASLGWIGRPKGGK